MTSPLNKQRVLIDGQIEGVALAIESQVTQEHSKVRYGMKPSWNNPTDADIDRNMNMRRNIEFGLLIVLAALVVLRPLIAETYDAGPAPFSQALGTLGNPMPARTVVFDIIILVCVCAWLLMRALGPIRVYRWTGLEVGLLLLTVASVLSCIWAGQQRLAINASLDWLCYPLFTIVLVQLMPKPWHRRLVTAAIVASASIQAFDCFEQYFAGQAETFAYYQSIKDSFWQAQGIKLTSPTVELFERRMQANEVQGFLPHSNVTGAYLILVAFAAVGLVLDRRRTTNGLVNWRVLLLQSPIVAAILMAAFLTRSLGALVSAVVGLLFGAVTYALRHRLSKQPHKFLVLGWACALAGIAAFIGHGLYHDSFPHMSLTFRWQYWKASWPMILDHWLTGVGRENFGRHYLQYKSIASPEEIANPHNLFVQFAADWGVIGLAAVVAMLIGVTIVLVNHRAKPVDLLRSNDTKTPLTFFMIAGLAWVFVVTAIRAPLLDSTDPSFLYYTTVVAGLCFITSLSLFGWPTGRSFDAESNQQPTLQANLFAKALTGGLLAFVVHETINFALFVPATATTFCAILAIRLAESNPRACEKELAKKPMRWFLPLVATGTTVTVVFFIVSPIFHSNALLRQARQTIMSPTQNKFTTHRVEALFTQAMTADPLDPTPHAEYAQWLLANRSQDQRDEFSAANESLEQAILRDPFYIRYRRLQRQLGLRWYEIDKNPVHLELALNAARVSLQLYPEDPDSLIDLGDTLALVAQKTGRAELRNEAINRYEESLDLDNRRAWFERIRRYNAERRQSIQKRIRSLKFLPLPSGTS